MTGAETNCSSREWRPHILEPGMAGKRSRNLGRPCSSEAGLCPGRFPPETAVVQGQESTTLPEEQRGSPPVWLGQSAASGTEAGISASLTAGET